MTIVYIHKVCVYIVCRSICDNTNAHHVQCLVSIYYLYGTYFLFSNADICWKIKAKRANKIIKLEAAEFSLENLFLTCFSDVLTIFDSEDGKTVNYFTLFLRTSIVRTVTD